MPTLNGSYLIAAVAQGNYIKTSMCECVQVYIPVTNYAETALFSMLKYTRLRMLKKSSKEYERLEMVVCFNQQTEKCEEL